MKISKITVWQVDLPLHEGDYKWSGGKSVETFDSTIVGVETDEGVTGFGEVCPLGPVYLASYAKGVRVGIEELGPSLLGENPLHLEKLNRLMDQAMKGHPYVKSAIDVACWDILGKVSGLPVSSLLGGAYGEDFVLYRAISQESPEEMAKKIAGYREEGYRRFQLKVGGDSDTDIERIRQASAQLQPGDKLVADANTGWLKHEAMRVVEAVRDIDVYIEQPCLRYEDCLSVRQHTNLPLGLTRAKQARDLCVSLGVAMTLEDTWGGDIVTAAIAHLAHSTPTDFLFTATDFNSYVTQPLADGAPQRVKGRMASSTAPGLGIEPMMDVLGDPEFVIS